MGSAGFEPTTSSARGWHHTKLDYDPFSNVFNIIVLSYIYYVIGCLKILSFQLFRKGLSNYGHAKLMLISSLQEFINLSSNGLFGSDLASL